MMGKNLVRAHSLPLKIFAVATLLAILVAPLCSPLCAAKACATGPARESCHGTSDDSAGHESLASHRACARPEISAVLPKTDEQLYASHSARLSINLSSLEAGKFPLMPAGQSERSTNLSAILPEFSAVFPAVTVLRI
jgi:hypothetical protein